MVLRSEHPKQTIRGKKGENTCSAVTSACWAPAAWASIANTKPRADTLTMKPMLTCDYSDFVAWTYINFANGTFCIALVPHHGSIH